MLVSHGLLLVSFRNFATPQSVMQTSIPSSLTVSLCINERQQAEGPRCATETHLSTVNLSLGYVETTWPQRKASHKINADSLRGQASSSRGSRIYLHSLFPFPVARYPVQFSEFPPVSGLSFGLTACLADSEHAPLINRLPKLAATVLPKHHLSVRLSSLLPLSLSLSLSLSLFSHAVCWWIVPGA